MDDLILLFERYGSAFLEGGAITIKITLIGLALGAALGLPTALLRVYGKGLPRRIAIGYIEIFRGTPLLVQLFVIYYGLPDFGLTLSQLLAAYLAVGLNSAAYQAEYFRSAIQAIGQGQLMAARAVGMSQFKAIRHIVLPQALRLVIPAWSNEVISVLKATAVVFVIAVPDLMTKAKMLAARFFDPIQAYSAVAVAYLLLFAAVSVLMFGLERWLAVPGLGVRAERH